MEYRLGPTLLPAAEIRARVRELAQAISRDYAGRDLLLICVLKGAAIFWADLCRALQVPCQSDFVAMESYGDFTAPLARPRFTKAADVSLVDRDVLIVEDIIDTGHTIVRLRSLLQAQGARSVALCALLD
jgi:hypoxanthine phosphoribosyltransferase